MRSLSSRPSCTDVYSACCFEENIVFVDVIVHLLGETYCTHMATVSGWRRKGDILHALVSWNMRFHLQPQLVKTEKHNTGL